MSQLDLFGARAKRDDGMARAEAHADPDWNDVAWFTLLDYLRGHPSYFCDDFWKETHLERPRESRAFGPVVLRAIRAGYLVKTNEARPSVASNLTPKHVYRSTLYQLNGGTHA